MSLATPGLFSMSLIYPPTSFSHLSRSQLILLAKHFPTNASPPPSLSRPAEVPGRQGIQTVKYVSDGLQQQFSRRRYPGDRVTTLGSLLAPDKNVSLPPARSRYPVDRKTASFLFGGTTGQFREDGGSCENHGGDTWRGPSPFLGFFHAGGTRSMALCEQQKSTAHYALALAAQNIQHRYFKKYNSPQNSGIEPPT